MIHTHELSEIVDQGGVLPCGKLYIKPEVITNCNPLLMTITGSCYGAPICHMYGALERIVFITCTDSVFHELKPVLN